FNDVDHLFLMPRHLGKRDSFSSFRISNYLACVVVWDETFWGYVEEDDGKHKKNYAYHDRQNSMFEGEFECPTIATYQTFIGTLGPTPETAQMFFFPGSCNRFGFFGSLCPILLIL